MEEAKINKIRPQKGYQTMFLSSSADIVIGGGAAGVGKTFALLLEALRHSNTYGFGAVFFRRTYTQIKSEGGIWDASKKIYSHFENATEKGSSYEWFFGDKAKIKFSHLEYEKNIYDWQGSEIPLICFDELTHFSKNMFFYLLSRNRSTCGIKPYVRATCNPDSESWVAEFVSWWIDQETGYPIPERQGKIRYFVRDGESFIWGDTEREVAEKADYYLDPLIKNSNGYAKYEHFIKSATFIGGSIYDNSELLKINPEYLGNLASQSESERLRLLHGCWKPFVSENDVYDYRAFRDMFTNTFVSPGERRIVIDVAGEGDDFLVAGFFNGYRLEDIELYSKTTGKDVIDLIISFKNKHGVRNSNIIYDADGVGFFIGGKKNGFIQGSMAFHNNGKPIDTGDDRTFKNIKTQCYIYSGERALRGESYISERVASKMYDDNSTIKQRFMLERKAIKIEPKKDEEATRLISKDEMRQKYLNGSSPDLLDMFMMNELFDLKEYVFNNLKQESW
jgi:hypothetical protein